MRKIICALPIIAAVLVWGALLSTPVYTKAPHAEQVKIAVIIAVAWLLVQIAAATVTRQPKSQQQGTRPRRKQRRQQDTTGYDYQTWQ